MPFVILFIAVMFIFLGIGRVAGSGRARSQFKPLPEVYGAERESQINDLERIIREIENYKAQLLPTWRRGIDDIITLARGNIEILPAPVQLKNQLEPLKHLLKRMTSYEFNSSELERGMYGIKKSLLDQKASMERYRNLQGQYGSKTSPTTQTETKDTRGGKTFKSIDTSKMQDASAKSLVEKGLTKLTKIHDYKEKIKNETTSKKVDEVAEVVYEILAEISRDEKDAKLAKNFVNNYLDSTLNILKKYCELESGRISSDNVTALLERTNSVLDTIREGFVKQLEKLKADDIMELEVEMETLRKTLELEG